MGRSRPTLLLCAAALFAASLAGACAADSAPEADLDRVVRCPDLIEYLPRTSELLADDGIPGLKASVQGELDAGSRQVAVALVMGVLRIVPPRHFVDLEPLLASPQLAAILDLMEGVLAGSARLPPPIQRDLYAGLHRWVDKCDPVALLKGIRRLMTLPPEVRAAVPALLDGLRRQVNTQAVSAEAWRTLLVSLAEVLAAADDSRAGLRLLAQTLLASAEPATREAALKLVDDDELIEAFSESARCLLEAEVWADHPVLLGIGHLIAEEAVDLDTISQMVAPTGDDTSAEKALDDILSGLIADEDARDSLRLALVWLLEPSRAARVVPDVGAMVESGAVAEILNLLARIGALDCKVGPPE